MGYYGLGLTAAEDADEVIYARQSRDRPKAEGYYAGGIATL